MKQALLIFALLFTLSTFANDTIKGLIRYQYKDVDGLVVYAQRPVMVVEGKYYWYHYAGRSSKPYLVMESLKSDPIQSWYNIEFQQYQPTGIKFIKLNYKDIK